MSDVINAVIENGQLVVRVPLEESYEPSKTGLTFVIASTHGNKGSSLTIKHPRNGKDVQVYIGVNAYVYANTR